MTIYVINPNSSSAVTDGIERAVRGRAPNNIPVTCLTTPEGPPGIETDGDVVTAAIHIAARANTLRDASALVVACFSDPGVESLRPMLSVPVFGIREAAVSTALKRVSRFGVIALSEASVRRHLVAFEEMGVTDRLAGDRALGLSVADLESPETSKQRILDVANELKVTNGAETLILGCAGMPQYKQFIETETGLPVIEPCQAAVDMAVEAITLPGA